MIITHSRRLKTKVSKSMLGNSNYISVNQQQSSGIGSSYPALRDYNNGDGNGNGDDSSIQPLWRLMWIIDKREISITCTSRTTNCCKRTYLYVRMAELESIWELVLQCELELELEMGLLLESIWE